MIKGRWYVEEDEHMWQLFFKPDGEEFMMASQIAKCPKKNTPYAEYWPTEAETKFILDALNEKSR